MPDYYNDGAGEAPEAGATPGGGAGDQAQGQTALVSKSIFGSQQLKPGDKCDIEIVAVHEDDYEVKYPEGAETQEQTEPAEVQSDEGMGSMME